MQDWLIREIPTKDWCDKVELIPRLLFAMLVHFVEEEGGLKQLDYDWTNELVDGVITQEYVDKRNKDYTELKDAYEFVKNVRPKLQQELEDSYPEPDLHNVIPEIATKEEYNTLYANTNRIEDELNARELAAIQTIVKHYQILWT